MFPEKSPKTHSNLKKKMRAVEVEGALRMVWEVELVGCVGCLGYWGFRD